MDQLTRDDLMSLEEYAENRADFRARAMAHKKHRRVSLGPHMNLYFEDRLTMQYQIQEMLRIEKIFEAQGIQEELDTYNALIPDGTNWKATAMLEYQDAEERREQLKKLRGIEDLIWFRVGDFDEVYCIANEDLERSDEEKTSAVHFIRFELTPEMIAALRDGATLTMGVNHDLYRFETVVGDPTRAALLKDLEG